MRWSDGGFHPDMSALSVIALLLLIASQVLLGRIFRQLKETRLEDWEGLGKPISILWAPPGLRSCLLNGFSKPLSSGLMLGWAFVFSTPDSFRGDARTKHWIWIYRALTIAFVGLWAVELTLGLL